MLVSTVKSQICGFGLSHGEFSSSPNIVSCHLRMVVFASVSQ